MVIALTKNLNLMLMLPKKIRVQGNESFLESTGDTGGSGENTQSVGDPKGSDDHINSDGDGLTSASYGESRNLFLYC